MLGASMGDTVLTFSVENWVTVLIMVAVGFTVLGAVTKIVRQRAGE